MSKKKVLDPAIQNAEKTPDKVFERGRYFSCEKGSTVKQFGRNRLLNGKHKLWKKQK